MLRPGWRVRVCVVWCGIHLAKRGLCTPPPSTHTHSKQKRRIRRERVASGLPPTPNELEDTSIISLTSTITAPSEAPPGEEGAAGAGAGAAAAVEWVDRAVVAWEGPPEFLSATTWTENPNPLPPYKQCSSCLPKMSAAQVKARRTRIRRLSVSHPVEQAGRETKFESSDEEEDAKKEGGDATQNGAAAGDQTGTDGPGLEQTIKPQGTRFLSAALAAASDDEEEDDPFLTGRDIVEDPSAKDVRKPFLHKEEFPEIFKQEPLEVFPTLSPVRVVFCLLGWRHSAWVNKLVC